MNWTKLVKLVFSIYIILNTIPSEVDARIPVNTTEWKSPVCITNGAIASGIFVMVNATEFSFKPVRGLCPTGSILLQPGVIFTSDFSNFTVVGPEGLCASRGVFRTGILSTIGTPVPLGQNISAQATCSFVDEFTQLPSDYAFLETQLNFKIFLEVLDQNTVPSDVFFVEDSPLLAGLSYTTTLLNESVCIESGVLVNVAANSFTDNVSLFDQTNGICTNGTLPLGFGSLDNTPLSNTILSDGTKCLGNNVVLLGRVLVTGELTPVGQVITSGVFSGLNCSEDTNPTGVVLDANFKGIFLITPIATSTAKYTRPPKYYPPYDNNKPIYSKYNNARRIQNEFPLKPIDRLSNSNWQRQVDLLSNYIDKRIEKTLNKENRLNKKDNRNTNY